MAIPKNLPIFRDMMRLTDMLLDDMENIARKYRRTLGERILDTTFACFRCLQYAYDSQGEAWKAGFLPFAMLYRDHDGKYDKSWRQFQRQWANHVITACNCLKYFGK